MSDEFDTDAGVVTGEGETTGLDTGDGGAPDSAREPAPSDDAQLTQGPWNKDPRFREFLTEFKDWRSSKGDFSKYRTEFPQMREEYEAFRSGNHTAYAEKIQARDEFWKKALQETGTFDILKRHFDAKFGGGAKPEAEAHADKPWEKDVSTLKEQLEAEREYRESQAAEAMRGQLNATLNATIQKEAPQFAANPKAVTRIAAIAVELAKADMVPSPTRINPDQMKMRHGFDKYVTDATNELKELLGAGAPAAKRAVPPKPGIRGGAATPEDGEAARKAKASALFDEIAEGRG